MTEPRTENIYWLGHDSFRIEGEGKVIYIDPWHLSGGPKADVIFITHDHFDHCSPEDVAKIQTKETVIVTIESAAAKLGGDIQVVKPGDRRTVKGISIEVVPAYNIDKFRSPGVPFHPKEAGHVGYIFTIEGQRIYHAGDTDPIPEMEAFEVDIALLPVSGTYVMTSSQAVEAARTIRPKLVIPMHVGAGIGSLDDAADFEKLAPVPVKILEISG